MISYFAFLFTGIEQEGYSYGWDFLTMASIEQFINAVKEDNT